MAIRIVLFDPAHCDGAKAHPSQAHYQYMLDDPGVFREHWPETYSARDGAELVAIGGSTWVDRVLGGWVLVTARTTQQFPTGARHKGRARQQLPQDTLGQSNAAKPDTLSLPRRGDSDSAVHAHLGRVRCPVARRTLARPGGSEGFINI